MGGSAGRGYVGGGGTARAALLICGRYGEQFSYIVCDRPDDSAVWYVNVWDRRPREMHDSVFGFLESMRADAEYWIRRGLG